MADLFSLTVDSRMERLGEISDFVSQAARASGLSEHQIYDVEVAVDEACANVIEHAYHGRADGTIDITCERRGKEFVITIQDFGERFDPRRIAPPKTRVPLAKRNVGGLGLFFMRKLMDKVDFNFSPKHGNRLTMVKKIKSKP